MAAPSASSYGWSYDVFLNFRGVDTCKTFTGHLYNALESAGIHTFRDDKLRTGEEIGPELLSAIQQSRISIPIFSKNYASSKWCLNELVKIVECRKTMNQLVLPIFYNVDPSDVCNQTGNYEEAFQKHNNHFQQRIIDEWKEALREVGVLKRWDLKNIANGHEATLVQLVVAEVINKLRKDSRIVSDDLVGIQCHAEKMMSLLNIKSGDVKIVGVWGLGGIGKTTIANVVYNVRGLSLFRVQRSAWQCTLKMLQEIPNEEVQKKLRISFDGLRDWQQGIFLDIACFFIGMDKNIAYYIWNQCGFYAEIGIDALCQKSLVKIGENNELKMHDQLRDLGREIIRQENLKVPREHSRLWFHKVAMHVLEKHMGTEKVEALCIDFKDSSRSQRCLMSEGFTEMTKLRLLQVDHARFAPDFIPSFSELVWLRWRGCPHPEFTLTRFHRVNLAVLDLSYSHVTIYWKG